MRMCKIAIAAALAVALSLVVGPSLSIAQAQQTQPVSLPSGGQWRTLPEPELQSLILKHKIGGINRFGEPFLVTLNLDYTVSAQAHPAVMRGNQYNTNPYALRTDSGRWKLRGNKICITMQKWLNQAENCWALATDGSQYRYVDTGTPYRYPEAYLDAVPWAGNGGTPFRWQHSGG